MIYFFVSLITYLCYQILKERKILITLENNNYNLKKTFLTKQNFLTLELLGIIIIVISFILEPKITGICMIILYMVLSLLEIKNTTNKYKHNKKNNKTIMFTILVYVVIFGLIVLDYYTYQKGFMIYNRINYYYPVAIISGYLLYIITYLSAFLAHKIDNKLKTK